MLFNKDTTEDNEDFITNTKVKDTLKVIESNKSFNAGAIAMKDLKNQLKHHEKEASKFDNE